MLVWNVRVKSLFYLIWQLQWITICILGIDRLYTFDQILVHTRLYYFVSLNTRFLDLTVLIMDKVSRSLNHSNGISRKIFFFQWIHHFRLPNINKWWRFWKAPWLLTKWFSKWIENRWKYLPYARHHRPLLIRSRSWIQAIHKAKGHST